MAPNEIDSQIVSEAYHTFPGTTLTVCALTLANGVIVTGESMAATPENTDKIGHPAAREMAREKVWALEGYNLRHMLSSRLGIKLERVAGPEA